jgi:hypothetical protein
MMGFLQGLRAPIVDSEVTRSSGLAFGLSMNRLQWRDRAGLAPASVLRAKAYSTP